MSEYSNNGRAPGEGAAVGSLVCGILSLVISGVGLILGVIGLVLASNARRDGYEGGLRTAGFILSLLGVIFGAIGLFACVCAMG